MLLYATPALTAYVLFVTCLVGLVMGSFLNCMAWRMTHGESVVHGRSHCATCGHVLAPRDLVPVFSWLASRGRCRYCGQHISARYPATEVLCAVVYVSIVCRFDVSLEALEMLCFASALFVLSLTDIDSFIIPNGCLVFALVVRVVYILSAGALGEADVLGTLAGSLLSGACVGAAILVIVLVMDRVLGRESMGGGDVKLLAVAACYFGWQLSLFLIVVACILGIIVGLAGARKASAQDGDAPGSSAQPRTASRPFPWGPSIAVACWVTMLAGEPFAAWYLGLFL